MKYFLDTEFHEYSKKPLFSKSIDTIELISIGIISEGVEYCVYCDKIPCECNKSIQQKEYYAICKEFDLKAAWKNEWLRNNVLFEIWKDLYAKTEISWEMAYFSFDSMKKVINKHGKTKKQIAKEIVSFIYDKPLLYNHPDCEINQIDDLKENKSPEFYAYYADYDWVIFCWLFGRMIDLPKGFPMYCKDLQQIKDEWIIGNQDTIKDYNKDLSTKKFYYLEDLEKYPGYPKQTNEHNALADAKWNYELYKFLQTL